MISEISTALRQPPPSTSAMPLTTAFLPKPALNQSRLRYAPKQHLTKLQVSATAKIPRRKLLSLLIIPLIPLRALAREPKPLAAALSPLISLQSTLSTLRNEIENGSNGDIRRVVKTLLIAADIPNNLKDAVTYLPKGERETVLGLGREAYEYLNQVIEYYEPVDGRARASGAVMAFCLEAVKKADDGLGEVVGYFGEDANTLRRMLESVDDLG